MMDARELAIRKNQTHRMLEWVTGRIKFIERDIRRCANDFERDRLEYGRRELDRFRVRLTTELASLKAGVMEEIA